MNSDREIKKGLFEKVSFDWWGVSYIQGKGANVSGREHSLSKGIITLELLAFTDEMMWHPGICFKIIHWEAGERDCKDIDKQDWPYKDDYWSYVVGT